MDLGAANSRMSLERFHVAQASAENGAARAIAELRAGEKQSHWIWYIFPQLAGLGHSSTARFYSLAGLDEAFAYLRSPSLWQNYRTACAAVVDQLRAGKNLTHLMGGSVDRQKLISSLTLFEVVADRLSAIEPSPEIREIADNAREILAAAERESFSRCEFTLRALHRAGDPPVR